MPSVSIELFRKTDTEPVIDAETIVAATKDTPWRAILIEGGMESGNPSVALAIDMGGGNVVVHETSLMALNVMVRALIGMAEGQLGWKMPL